MMNPLTPGMSSALRANPVDAGCSDEPRWQHIQWSTYGVWLPGDPRGFRSRDGRIKSMPYDPYSSDGHKGHRGLYRHAVSMMKKHAVILDVRQRRIVLGAILEKVAEIELEMLCVAVCQSHVHLLAKLEVGEVRREMGRLKRHASHTLTQIPGAVWGARCHAELIRDRKHQVNTYNYIVRHREERAAVWSFRDGRA